MIRYIGGEVYNTQLESFITYCKIYSMWELEEFSKKNIYKWLKDLSNNNNDIITELDNIAKIVPIDINKRDDTDAKFIPKHKQI